MDIISLGHSCIKLKGKNQTVIIDPFDPEKTGMKFGNEEADILLISHDHPDHNFENGVSNVKKVVKYPGEYEIGGVSVVGFKSFHDNSNGSERGGNVIYRIEMEKMVLLHCGDLGHLPKKDLIDDIGVIDILFVPVGGFYTIDAKDAWAFTQSLSPKIIIPIHYKTEKHKDKIFENLAPVSQFVELTGINPESMGKLSIKNENLVEDSVRLITLDA